MASMKAYAVGITGTLTLVTISVGCYWGYNRYYADAPAATAAPTEATPAATPAASSSTPTAESKRQLDIVPSFSYEVASKQPVRPEPHPVPPVQQNEEEQRKRLQKQADALERDRQLDEDQRKQRQEQAEELEKLAAKQRHQQKQAEELERQRQADALDRQRQLNEDQQRQRRKQAEELEKCAAEQQFQQELAEELGKRRKRQADAFDRQRRADALEWQRQADALEKQRQADALDRQREVDALYRQRQADALEKQRQAEEQRRADALEKQRQADELKRQQQDEEERQRKLQNQAEVLMKQKQADELAKQEHERTETQRRAEAQRLADEKSHADALAKQEEAQRLSAAQNQADKKRHIDERAEVKLRAAEKKQLEEFEKRATEQRQADALDRQKQADAQRHADEELANRAGEKRQHSEPGQLESQAPSQEQLSAGPSSFNEDRAETAASLEGSGSPAAPQVETHYRRQGRLVQQAGRKAPDISQRHEQPIAPKRPLDSEGPVSQPFGGQKRLRLLEPTELDRAVTERQMDNRRELVLELDELNQGIWHQEHYLERLEQKRDQLEQKKERLEQKSEQLKQHGLELDQLAQQKQLGFRAADASLVLPPHSVACNELVSFLELYSRGCDSSENQNLTKLCTKFKAVTKKTNPKLLDLIFREPKSNPMGEYYITDLDQITKDRSVRSLLDTFSKDPRANIFAFLQAMNPKQTPETLLHLLSSDAHFGENRGAVEHLARLITLYTTLMYEQSRGEFSDDLDAITLSDIDLLIRDTRNSTASAEAPYRYDNSNISGKSVLKSLAAANVTDPEAEEITSAEDAEALCSGAKKINAYLSSGMYYGDYVHYRNHEHGRYAWLGPLKLNEMDDGSQSTKDRIRNIAGVDYNDKSLNPCDVFKAQITRPKLLAILVEHVLYRSKQRSAASRAELPSRG
ncbi:hypothetical protein PAPHI01_0418 [Pancytospora philotis]|nr:hypothetical protein PAPHI01_0418 [Pancytospora philotis]